MIKILIPHNPPVPSVASDWTPPKPRSLGGIQTPVEDWRLLANEPADRTLQRDTKGAASTQSFSGID